MNHMALFGDSAGGNLAIRAVLNLREEGAAMPAAVLLFSPWADLTNAGDTAITLTEADPTLSYDRPSGQFGPCLCRKPRPEGPARLAALRRFRQGLSAHAHPGRHAHHPPERPASAPTAHSRPQARMRRLDLYEGMWHVFQGAPAPEAAAALGQAGAFLRQTAEVSAVQPRRHEEVQQRQHGACSPRQCRVRPARRPARISRAPMVEPIAIPA